MQFKCCPKCSKNIGNICPLSTMFIEQFHVHKPQILKTERHWTRSRKSGLPLRPSGSQNLRTKRPANRNLFFFYGLLVDSCGFSWIAAGKAGERAEAWLSQNAPRTHCSEHFQSSMNRRTCCGFAGKCFNQIRTLLTAKSRTNQRNAPLQVFSLFLSLKQFVHSKRAILSNLLNTFQKPFGF